MRSRAAAAALLLVSIAALAGAKGAPRAVRATWGSTCAPWDGPALQVSVAELHLTVILYGEDMARFRSGKTVVIKAKPKSEESRASVPASGTGLGSRGVAAELRMDPKTGKGRVKADGVGRRAVFKGSAEPRPFCG